MRLMPFQEIGRDFLLSRERCLLADEMGTGKGCQSITAAEKIGGNILLITKASLTLNIEREIKKWIPDAQVIQLRDEKSEVKLTGRVRFVVVSYNYLQQEKNVARLCKVKWSVIIADEFHKCVHKDTIVKTPEGDKKIGDLRKGDYVYSFRKNKLVRNRIGQLICPLVNQQIITLYLENNQKLTCLADHKIQLYDGEWKKAIQIRTGENLRGVQQEISRKLRIEKHTFLFKAMFGALALPSKFRKFKRAVLKKMVERKSRLLSRREKTLDVGAHETFSADAIQKCSRKVIKNVKAHETQTACSGREWQSYSKGATESSKIIKESIRRKGAARICGFFKRFRQNVPKSLQDRLCGYFGKIGCRDRWTFTRLIKKASTGSEENASVEKVRVERIEVQESNSARDSERSIQNFIDLALEKYPYNYIANGVVVHNCKNPKTQTTKGFKKLIKGHAGKIWLMTGSPATNTGADYYMFLETCLPGKWGTYSEFRELFCNKVVDYWSGAPKYTGVRDDKKAILRQAFKKITLRRRLAEVVKELPDKIVQTLVVDVGEKKLPDSFSYDEIVEMMNKGKVPAKMAGEMQRVGLKKIEPAIDYIQECQEPIVVFFAHRAVLAGVKTGLKDKRVVTITGADSREEKNRAEQDFQNGKADVILLNLQAGSEGYTLTASKHMLFVEYPWSPAVLDQAMGRILRIGQQASCVHITKMVAENSHDVKVLKALESKSEFMKAVMGDDLWKG